MKAILTSREVAEYLSLNEQTVNRFLREGRLKGFQIGRVWRVKGAALAAFIEQEQTSQPEAKPEEPAPQAPVDTEEPSEQGELIAPPEADRLSREAIDKLNVKLWKQGLSNRRIAQELNDRGLTMAKGNPFKTQTASNRRTAYLKTPAGKAYLKSLEST